MHIAFTGHRPTKLPCGYDESHPICLDIKSKLRGLILEMVNTDSLETVFITGMALGIDIWAAEIVLDIKKDHPNKDIRLICAIPYEGHIRSMFDDQWKKRYQMLLNGAFERHVLSPKYYDGCLLARNRWMVDHADSIIAVFDNALTYGVNAKKSNVSVEECIQERGGTAATIRYALRCRKPISAIDPLHLSSIIRFSPSSQNQETILSI